MDTSLNQSKQAKQSFNSVFITIVIPSMILIFFKKQLVFPAEYILILALSFPVLYSCFEWIKDKKVSFFSIFGFISVLLTGGIGILKLPTEWVAIKESMIPFVIGLVVVFSCIKKKPAIRFILSAFLNQHKINERLKELKNKDKCFQLEIKATYMLSVSFLISAFLNFFLATYIVKSPSGTAQFNHEVGVLTALSYPIIAVPSMIILSLVIWYVIHHLKKLTDLSFVDLIKQDYNI